MTRTLEPSPLYANTDLHDEDQSFNTYRFCVPIYITDCFGPNLKKEADLISTEGEPPRIRSGTLTFVSREGQIYGITCRHVVEALEQEEADVRAEWEPMNVQPPLGGFQGFRFPAPREQIHINAQFYKAPVDLYTNHGRDLAIARIPSDTFAKVRREALPFERIGMPPSAPSDHLCGIATGFPEQIRISRQSAGGGAVLGMLALTAVARFDVVGESGLRMYDEIAGRAPDANNLSGMSGGPIL